ncbi:hypothetical protein MMC26_004777 [Xylographa opegraphella]|nr:hypothetical protein [Xylographa opegraphella]
MASTSTPTTSAPTGKPPKTLSSRLMAMKFMQRAAASSVSSTTSDSTSAKRQKRNDSSPVTPSSDVLAIQAALAAEEAKRAEALARQQAEAGETKWVLSFQKEERAERKEAFRIDKKGYEGIDALQRHEDEPWRPAMVGRRSFGKFNRALEKRQNPNAESSSSNESSNGDLNVDSNGNNVDDGNSDDSNNEPAGMKQLIRESKLEVAERAKAERKAQRREKKAEAKMLADRRKSREIKLNKLSSISGGGGAWSAGGSFANKECFVCGKKGHGKKDCPERKLKRARTGGD